MMPLIPSSDASDVDTLVREEIVAALRAEGKLATSFDANTRLDGELGLASLQVVELASRIGLRLGTRELERPGVLMDVRTVGDLCAACRDALPDTGSRNLDTTADLKAIRERAQGRRLQRPRA